MLLLTAWKPVGAHVRRGAYMYTNADHGQAVSGSVTHNGVPCTVTPAADQPGNYHMHAKPRADIPEKSV